MKVRVVNLWHPVDSTTGGADRCLPEIAQDGKKPMTVAPGTVSEPRRALYEEARRRQGEKTFNLSFYPEGVRSRRRAINCG